MPTKGIFQWKMKKGILCTSSQCVVLLQYTDWYPYGYHCPTREMDFFWILIFSLQKFVADYQTLTWPQSTCKFIIQMVDE